MNPFENTLGYQRRAQLSLLEDFDLLEEVTEENEEKVEFIQKLCQCKVKVSEESAMALGFNGYEFDLLIALQAVSQKINELEKAELARQLATKEAA